MDVNPPVQQCRCCGSFDLTFTPVLWPELINAWRLNANETAYIDRQQGLKCRSCGSSFRSMALAVAIMRSYGFDGLFNAFHNWSDVARLQILEVNEAGHLTQFVSNFAGHILRAYPEIDMMCLPYPEDSFDLVLHSDTLEHVSDPVRALAECRRVLRPGGFCAFTVPIIVDRLTTSREGLPTSYHGSPGEKPEDFKVYTEYGADAWKHVVEAGFVECRMCPLEYPAALALVGVKGHRAQTRSS